MPCLYFFYCYRHHRDLHSFPTRRSSDLENNRLATTCGSAHGSYCPASSTSTLFFYDVAADVSWIGAAALGAVDLDRKSTRLNSSHVEISYAVFCLKKKNNNSCSSASGRS